MFAWQSSTVDMDLEKVTCTSANDSLFCGTESGSILVVDLKNQVQELIGHQHRITALVCYDDYLASGDESGLLIIWKYQEGGYYEEMTNDKIKSKLSTLSYSKSKIGMTYSNGSIMVGSKKGILIWHTTINATIADHTWKLDNLLVLVSNPCQIHEFDSQGQVLGVYSLSTQRPSRLLAINSPSPRISILIQSNNNLLGFTDIESSSVLDLGTCIDFCLLNNHIIQLRVDQIIIFNLAGKSVFQLKIDKLKLLTIFNCKLIALRSNSLVTFSIYERRQTITCNNHIVYTKTVNNIPHLFIYSPTFFNSIEIQDLDVFTASKRLICFSTYKNDMSTITICNYHGIVQQSFKLPMKVLSLVINSQLIGILTSQIYFIFKMDKLYYGDSNQQSRHCLPQEFKSFPSGHNYVACAIFNKHFYVLSSNGLLNQFNDTLILIKSYQFTLPAISNCKLLINKHYIAILNSFQLFVFDHSSTSILVRQNVLDLLLHNDPHICTLEKNKLCILNHESILCQNDILCSFLDYQIITCSFQDLPITCPLNDSIFKQVTMELRTIQIVNQIPKNHNILAKCLAIDYLKQNRLDIALECSKLSKDVKLYYFIKGLIHKNLKSVNTIMGVIYEYIKDFEQAELCYNKDDDQHSIALMYFNNKMYDLLDDSKISLLSDIQQIQVYEELGSQCLVAGNYITAYSYYKQLDNDKLCKEIALTSKDPLLLKNHSLKPIVKLDNVSKNLFYYIYNSNVKEALQILDKIKPEKPLEMKMKLYLECRLTKSYHLLHLQHFYCLSLKYLHAEEFQKCFSSTTPLIFHKYHINIVLLIRGIAAYFIQDYNASSACFGRYKTNSNNSYSTILLLNELSLTLQKYHVEAKDELVCNECRKQSRLQQNCSLCGILFKFDDQGQLTNSMTTCQQCGIIRVGELCLCCHFLNK